MHSVGVCHNLGLLRCMNESVSKRGIETYAMTAFEARGDIGRPHTNGAFPNSQGIPDTSWCVCFGEERWMGNVTRQRAIPLSSRNW